MKTALYTIWIRFSERSVTILGNLLSLQLGIRLNITDKKNDNLKYLGKGF